MFMTFLPCEWLFHHWTIVTKRWELFITTGDHCPDELRTTSPFLNQIVIKVFTPRFLLATEVSWKYKFEQRKCTAKPNTASLPTWLSKKAKKPAKKRSACFGSLNLFHSLVKNKTARQKKIKKCLIGLNKLPILKQNFWKAAMMNILTICKRIFFNIGSLFLHPKAMRWICQLKPVLLISLSRSTRILATILVAPKSTANWFH